MGVKALTTRAKTAIAAQDGPAKYKSCLTTTTFRLKIADSPFIKKAA